MLNVLQSACLCRFVYIVLIIWKMPIKIWEKITWEYLKITTRGLYLQAPTELVSGGTPTSECLRASLQVISVGSQGKTVAGIQVIKQLPDLESIAIVPSMRTNIILCPNCSKVVSRMWPPPTRCTPHGQVWHLPLECSRAGSLACVR